jgi:hypothetical protein
MLAYQSAWYRQKGDLDVASRSLLPISVLVENTGHWMRATSSSDSCRPILVSLIELGDMHKHWIKATSSSDSRSMIRVAHVSLVADMAVNSSKQQVPFALMTNQ